MNDAAVPPLVSTDWLNGRMGLGNVRVLDSSWYMPAQNRNAKEEYEQAHIQGAAFFDIDGIADTSSALPHMLPNPDAFAKAVGALGISNADTVVIYDGAGVFSAPRVWWTFRVFGHDNVAVLNGGLPKWRREGRPTEWGPMKCRSVPFTASYRPELVRDFAALSDNLTSRAAQVLDARSEGRFRGTEPEPRPGLKGGHIPDSRNVPFQALIDPTTGTMKSRGELEMIFIAAGISPNTPVVTSCGSGLTAAVLAFGLYLIGHVDAAVYDGSWSEWGARDDAPVER